ncbi:MAG: hypothetical protein WBA74_10185 [Cyclobacteriaceae bacterium]
MRHYQQVFFRSIRYLSLLSVIFLSCGETGSQNSIDINGMQINRSLINEITATVGTSYELFIITNWIQDPTVEAGFRIDTIRNGIEFKKIEEQKVRNILNRYNKILRPRDKYPFLTKASYNRKGNLSFNLVIISANDQFQALRTVRPDGLKEGVSHDEIFDLLVKLNQVNPIDIYLLDKNRVRLTLQKKLSQEWEEEIADLCPQYEIINRDLRLHWDK